MGIALGSDRNDNNVPDSRYLEAQMVISYLRQGKDRIGVDRVEETDNIDQMRSISRQSSNLSNKSLYDVISPNLFKKVQFNVWNLNHAPDKINPEEYKSVKNSPSPVFEPLVNIRYEEEGQPVEPHKVLVFEQRESESIQANSIQIPLFDEIPSISQKHEVFPEEPSKVTVNKYRSNDSVSIYTIHFNLKPSKPVKVVDKIPNPSKLLDLSAFVSSVGSAGVLSDVNEEASNDMRAANVFSNHHVFRGNPEPLKPLARLLNDKGALNHDDEVRISSTPESINKLLQQVTNK